MSLPDGVEILEPAEPRFDEILTDEALAFVAELAARFGGRRASCSRRAPSARRGSRGRDARLPARRRARSARATGRSPPRRADLRDRRVEITGPTDRKMVINALNSGARGFMADFEDAQRRRPGRTWSRARSTSSTRSRARSSSPAPTGASTGSATRSRRCSCARAAGTWPRSTCSSTASRSPAPVRLRALPRSTTRASCSSAARGPTSTCRSWSTTSRRGCGTTSSLRRRSALGIPRGTIRATVLIETLPAAFEMDEILYELREHSYGLNAGRWDYIFSMIKTFRDRPEFVLPDRTT